ncbi:MAG: chromosome partitioning protein ParB [Pseudonocardia sp.]
MRGDTGSPRADAEADFLRARRLQVIAAVTARLLRKESGDSKALSFQEVVDALGLVDEVSLGRRMIPVDQIVGSVDRVREFDPKFRPRTGLSRQRFERIDEAARRGEALPPIDVYQIGDIYFVRDGHHRVAVHRALDLPEIEADVRLVRTVVEPDDVRARSDLAARELRRLFLQRVPVPRSAYYALILSDPQQYPWFAEMVEAWAARLMFAEGTCLNRREAAGRWYAEEFAPVVRMIEDGDLLGNDETEADAYMRIAGERYAVFHHHDWNAEIIAELGRRR